MADKKTHKLLIGSANPDLLRHGTADGKPGTFLLSQPDVSAFESTLIEAKKPAETPALAPTPQPIAPPKPETPSAQEAPVGDDTPTK